MGIGGYDRHCVNNTRTRRLMQQLQAGTSGVTYAPPIVYDPDTATVSVGLIPAGSGLQIDVNGNLGILLQVPSGLVVSAVGLAILLNANPGLQLAAGGLSVLLNGTSLSTVGGLSVTAPEGGWSVTAVKTANYAANIGELVRADATLGAFNITLPTAVGNSGRKVAVKQVTSVAGVVTVNTTGGQTIDGLATDPLAGLAKTFATFTSDGANWMIT